MSLNFNLFEFYLHSNFELQCCILFANSIQIQFRFRNRLRFFLIRLWMAHNPVLLSFQFHFCCTRISLKFSCQEVYILFSYIVYIATEYIFYLNLNALLTLHNTYICVRLMLPWPLLYLPFSVECGKLLVMPRRTDLIGEVLALSHSLTSTRERWILKVTLSWIAVTRASV